MQASAKSPIPHTPGRAARLGTAAWKLIRSAALALMAAASLTTTAPAQAQAQAQATPATPAKKVLIVVTNHADYPSREDKTGLWLTELTHFWGVLQEGGVAMDIASPAGGNSPLTNAAWAGSTWTTPHAHLRDPAFMARLQQTRRAADLDPTHYAAIYFTGGHGTMWDFRDAPELKRLAEAIHRQGGIVSAVCHGNAALVQLQGPDGKPLIAGRRVTGFSNIEERLAGVRDQVPFLLQDVLQAAGAKYEQSWIPFTSYAVTDGRLVTGQNPQSGKAVGQQVLKLLRAQASASPAI